MNRIYYHHNSTAVSPIGNARGAVAVIAALSLTALMIVFAFTLDVGYLYSEKNRFQNAVEAAAMAGAVDLCGDDPVETARRVAEENGIEGAFDETILTVSFGYYDEHDVYSDGFSEYKDFEADPDPDTPENEAVNRIDGDCCQYNNAVLVQLRQPVGSLTGGMIGEATSVVRASAIAYLARYDTIAGEGGLTVNIGFDNGYPLFKDTTIHANGDIQFQGTEGFEGDVRIIATGDISGCSIDYTENNPRLELELKPLDIVMEELKAKAESEGNLIEVSSWVGDGNWQDAPFGQYMYLGTGTEANISFSSGDHDDAVYFLSVEGDAGSGLTIERISVVSNVPNIEAWNFTLATDVPELYFQYVALEVTDYSLTLGGEGSSSVRIFASDYIRFAPHRAWWYAFTYICEGVFFRCSRFEHRWYPRSSWEDRVQKMRLSADEIIYRGFYGADPMFDSLFGPPCPPNIARLGRLEAIEK